MADQFQYIPFSLPDYLAQYFAAKINTRIYTHSGYRIIPVSRSTYLGKTILRSMHAHPAGSGRRRRASYYLQVSNFSGDHYPDTPRGTNKFLGIRPEVIRNIIEVVKMDFDDALVAFVDGAEFAHIVNGWEPNQKRKGIRKKAILEFCNKYQVSPDDRNLQALFKMYQRRKRQSNVPPTRDIRKFSEILSL